MQELIHRLPRERIFSSESAGHILTAPTGRFAIELWSPASTNREFQTQKELFIPSHKKGDVYTSSCVSPPQRLLHDDSQRAAASWLRIRSPFLVALACYQACDFPWKCAAAMSEIHQSRTRSISSQQQFWHRLLHRKKKFITR